MWNNCNCGSSHDRKNLGPFCLHNEKSSAIRGMARRCTRVWKVSFLKQTGPITCGCLAIKLHSNVEGDETFDISGVDGWRLFVLMHFVYYYLQTQLKTQESLQWWDLRVLETRLSSLLHWYLALTIDLFEATKLKTVESGERIGFYPVCLKRVSVTMLLSEWIQSRNMRSDLAQGAIASGSFQKWKRTQSNAENKWKLELTTTTNGTNTKRRWTNFELL